MWAGNQPFLEQPVLKLVDAGGNIVEDDSCGTLDAVLVRSLSQTSDISIDTSHDDVPTIESVQYHQSHLVDEQTEYSAGHNMSIIVTFTQEVSIITRKGIDAPSKLLPTLELNVLDENGMRSKAYLVNNNTKPSRNLEFCYTISRGPTTHEVNTFSRSSFETNDYLVVDAWKRNATIYLPSLNSTRSLLASKNVTVHSEPAIITDISTSVASGEYAAGRIIDFVVKFNRKVSDSMYIKIVEMNVNSHHFFPFRLQCQTILLCQSMSIAQ